MDTGKIVFIIVIGWTLFIHGGLSYLIIKNKDYHLISGFSKRPKEEQEYLMNSGYIEALGKVFKITFFILLIGFVLGLFSVPYGLEIAFGFYFAVILAGLIWVQKYEVPHKRKKMYWISSIIFVITIAIVVGAGIATSIGGDIKITDKELIITGAYGVEWALAEIKEVELLDELPKVKLRANGISTTNQKKGKFVLEEPYGRGLLFIKGNTSPYLYVATEEDYVILNRENKEETIKIYNKLREFIE